LKGNILKNLIAILFGGFPSKRMTPLKCNSVKSAAKADYDERAADARTQARQPNPKFHPA
jgi:hypothetical protein